jgi:protein SERAC1
LTQFASGSFDQALSIANTADEGHKNILECTRAIAFLGTPHRGSDLASWAKIAGNLLDIAKRPNLNILDVLKPQSEVLRALTTGFHAMLKSRERYAIIHIACFVEELAVTRLGKSFIVRFLDSMSNDLLLTIP